MCFAEDSGGDGKTTCLNCGRAKKLVLGTDSAAHAMMALATGRTEHITNRQIKRE